MRLFIDGQAFFASAPRSTLWQELESKSESEPVQTEEKFLFRTREGRAVDHWTQDSDGHGNPIAASYFGSKGRNVYGLDERSPFIGYRPVLYPLDTAGNMDSSVLESVTDWSIVELGGIAIFNHPASIPEFPGDLEYAPGPGSKYVAFNFTDTPLNREYRMRFVKVGHYLVCDRVILTNVSPRELRQKSLLDELPA